MRYHERRIRDRQRAKWLKHFRLATRKKRGTVSIDKWFSFIGRGLEDEGPGLQESET